MAIIKDVMRTTNPNECLITVDNENFLASTEIVIFNGDDIIKFAKISDIGYKKNLDGTIKNPIILIVKGVNRTDLFTERISEGIMVESVATSKFLDKFKFDKTIDSLNKIGVSVHDEQDSFRPFKDVLEDVAKVWNNSLSNNKKE